MRLRSLVSLSLGAFAVAACADTAPTITAPDSHAAYDAARAGASDRAFHTVAREWNVGEASACSLSDGTLYCWGENLLWNHGGPGPQQSSPFAPTAVQLGFVEMARGPGSQFFCGIRDDRSAVCWGRGGWGMTGRGVLDGFQNRPAPVSGEINWAEITTARLSACGVSTTGVGYCWGSNQRGEIGRAGVPLGGTNIPASLTLAPAEIDGGLIWRSVVAGWLHACGITGDMDAYCWGDNRRGQLGLGTIASDPVRAPARVIGGHKFIQLSLGATHTCGITLQHQVVCWGENFTGQVGDGSTTNVATPTLIGGRQRFSQVAAGSDFGSGGNAPQPPGAPQAAVGHTCALTPDGQAWCWGWNAAGQLGDGTTTSSRVPVEVGGGLRFTSLSLGGTASCGRNADRMWCWGGNQFGQLGIGSLANVSAPTLVNTPFDVR